MFLHVLCHKTSPTVTKNTSQHTPHLTTNLHKQSEQENNNMKKKKRRKKKNDRIVWSFYLFFSLPPSFVFSFLFSFSVYMLNETYNLRNKSRGSGTLVSPVGRQLAGATVVSCKTMDFRFNENKTKLRVSVLAVSFEMFTNGDSLFNKTV